jgi:hypothetical protein
MKVYVGVDLQIHIFLTSALATGEWLGLCPGRFTPFPQKKTRIALWIGGWFDPRACLDDVENILTIPGLEHRPLGRPASSQY